MRRFCERQEMRLALKCAIAICVGLGWQIVSGDLALSLVLTILIFAVLIINPKKEPSYQEGEEFKEKVREKNEQKLFLEEERILEKQQAAQLKSQYKHKST